MSTGQEIRTAHILVVDDESALRRILARILEREGYEVATAGDATAARELLATNSFDLVITDITMPGEDGLSLVRGIRIAWPETATLIVSGVSDAEVADQVLACGASGYVMKPFQSSAVIIEVQQAIGRHLQEQERSNELEATTRRLADTEVRFQALTAQSPLAILYSDVDGRCVYVNDMACDLAGRPAAALLGLGWVDVVHPDDSEAVLAALAHAREYRSSFVMEHRIRTQTDAVLWGELRVGPIVGDDAVVTGFQAIMTDITQRVEYHAQLERQSTHDIVTGLPNSAVVATWLDSGVEANRPVIAIAVERLDALRDAVGVEIVDAVLGVVARRISELVAGRAQIGSLDRGVFAVVPRASGDEDAVRLAEELLECVEAGEYPECPSAVTASAGVAMTDGSVSPMLVLRDATLAARRGGTTGGSRTRFADVAIREQVMRRFALENRLREGIHNGEIFVHYQPEFAVDGRLTGVEALARWQCDGEDIPPDVFIPIAERAGLIGHLGASVLERACHQVQSWRRTRKDLVGLVIAVNVSAFQLADDTFVATVEQILNRTVLPARNLCLEVTESAVMADPEVAVAQLRRLRDLGVAIALDDFGTGHSSFAQLTRLPLDLLKIDRAFVADMTQDARSRQLVDGMIHLAHVLGLTVIAEGVETHEQRESLSRLHCDLLQGFLLARPAPPDSLPLQPLEFHHVGAELVQRYAP